MGFRKKTVKDIDVAGKIVLVRVDYNVPMKDGVIVEDMRIRGSLPTIKYLLEQGAKRVVLMSHLGRPDGEVKPELSLRPCAERLGELLTAESSDNNFDWTGKSVAFCGELSPNAIELAANTLPDGSVLMLENLRFTTEEEENSDDFAAMLVNATGAEIFVQDGFAVIHRAHASTDAIARRLPAVCGFLVEDEVSHLEGVVSDPEHPLLVIIGGAKVEDKTPMIERFLPIADEIIVGGKIAADGYTAANAKVYVAEDFASNEEGAKLDVGEATIKHVAQSIKNARTIVWNGTLGYAEEKPFDKGSEACAIAMGSNEDAMTVVGGGDTAGYVEGLLKSHDDLKFSLISTGGGASLELLSGKKLPGFEVLLDA